MRTPQPRAVDFATAEEWLDALQAHDLNEMGAADAAEEDVVDTRSLEVIAAVKESECMRRVQHIDRYGNDGFDHIVISGSFYHINVCVYPDRYELDTTKTTDRDSDDFAGRNVVTRKTLQGVINYIEKFI
jgi:hypothetical protein